jgi:hypothetical protein
MKMFKRGVFKRLGYCPIRKNGALTDSCKMKNCRTDLTLSALLFILLLVLFVLASASLALNMGLSSADDGFFASVAKSLTMGQYGLPISSAEVSLFDPSIGSGPVLIGIGALATLIFGPQDFLGLVTLAVFLLQLALVVVLLNRQFSWASVLGFGFASLFLLMLAGKNNWYFGTFMGEAPAFGFVILGAVLLSSGEKRAWQILGGISFALAYLTKQISLFAIAGIIPAWLLYQSRNDENSKTFVKLALVISAIAVPVLIFEAIKLILLGLGAYLDLWSRVLHETEHMAIGHGGDRLGKFLATLSASYGPVWIISTIIIIFATPLVWRRYKYGKSKAAMLPLMLWSGGLTYAIYIGVLSTMWPRYFWIGIALLAFACGLTVLYLAPRARWVAISTLSLVFGYHVYTAFDGLLKSSNSGRVCEERSKVLFELSKYPSVPLAGRSWHSFYDLIYLMPLGRTWVTESDLGAIQNQDFMAVLNAAFGDKGKFFNAVSTGCESMLIGNRYSLYSCKHKFWAIYDAR